MQSDTLTHSPAWFDQCFGDVDVPPDLRATSEALCRRFLIKGICDPMYIANVLAAELGRGDGQGQFHAADSDARDGFSARFYRAVSRLVHAYGSCIGNEQDQVSPLLREHLNPAGALR